MVNLFIYIYIFYVTTAAVEVHKKAIKGFSSPLTIIRPRCSFVKGFKLVSRELSCFSWWVAVALALALAAQSSDNSVRVIVL